MLHYLESTGVQNIIGQNMIQDLIELFKSRAKPCGLTFSNSVFWTSCGKNFKEKYMGHRHSYLYEDNIILAPIDKATILYISQLRKN